MPLCLRLMVPAEACIAYPMPTDNVTNKEFRRRTCSHLSYRLFSFNEVDSLLTMSVFKSILCIVSYDILSTAGVQSFRSHYAKELQLNDELRQFVINASLLYGGYNSVAEQLHVSKIYVGNKGKHCSD